MHSPVMQVMLTILRMQTILIPKIIMQRRITQSSWKQFWKTSFSKKLREISKESSAHGDWKNIETWTKCGRWNQSQVDLQVRRGESLRLLKYQGQSLPRYTCKRFQRAHNCLSAK